MFINKLLCLEIRAFTFKHGLNRGILLSPSEMNMRNSVLQALLARIPYRTNYRLNVLSTNYRNIVYEMIIGKFQLIAANVT